jgi:hypothetical protein
LCLSLRNLKLALDDMAVHIRLKLFHFHLQNVIQQWNTFWWMLRKMSQSPQQRGIPTVQRHALSLAFTVTYLSCSTSCNTERCEALESYHLDVFRSHFTRSWWRSSSYNAVCSCWSWLCREIASLFACSLLVQQLRQWWTMKPNS